VQHERQQQPLERGIDMSRKVWVVCLLGASLFALPALAQEVDTKPTLIQFKLKEIDGTPTLQVGPRGAGVCKKAHAEKCPSAFKLRWLGRKDFGAEKLRIQFDDAAMAKACLGGDVIELSEAKGDKTVLISLVEGCTFSGEKTTLFFTVTCIDAAGEVCAGVAPVDPGVIIESGGP
jgi:hypothetical protein